MEPPCGTKRPLGGGDVDKASGARRYDGCDAAYDDFLKDDDEEGGGGDDDTGFLDESGTFVEHAGREGTKEDAWLGTPDADTASAATKRARKALQRQEEDERLVHDLVSARTVFEIKKRLAGLLEPGETVPRALRRLKGLGGGGPAYGGRGRTAGKMDEAARRAFDEITEAAAELFERGDLDAYSDDREEFESAAWVYEYGRRDRVSASAAREAGEEHEADRADNMFREDAGASGEDLREASGAAAEKGTGGDGSDYVYDPASGYYYSSSSGYFYDAASGCYCSASTGTWFSYNHHHNDGQVLRHNRRDVASDHLRSEHR